MLKIKKYFAFGYLALIFFITSCKSNDVDPAVVSTTDTTYTSVNSWVYELMNDAYFWYSNMPAESTLDKSINPTDFFEKLIYQRATVDRFSGITDDIDALQNEFNGISKIYGLSYTLSYLDDTKTSIGIFLKYVVKGSPAEAAGLKRGDIILKVNNTQLTADNYYTLLSSSETATFTLGTLTNGTIVANSTSISITKAEVSEDPVLFSTVISKPDYGKTVGYLVYTQFIPGTTADETKYDNELRQVFANFKSKGINELVLDLRFNGGGYLSSAETMASLIGKGASSSKVFYKEQWNDKYNAIWKKAYGANALNHNFLDEANNVGSALSRVFVLTSGSTASASELIINGLKPYIDVVTVGENTVGKNLFGQLFSDDQNRWNWGMYIMLGQITNANDQSDYGTVNGITPTYLVEDTSVPYKAFGDENETLLRKALDVMGIPADENLRVTATKKVENFSAKLYRDNLKVSEPRMIKTGTLTPK